ncbi:MAG: type II secretion system protein [bacterium]|nr:type II secretion system protein [bacterium]
MKIKRERISAFTLIELLVVISIISILMVISLVGTSAVRLRSRDAKRKSDLAKIQGYLTLYYADKKTYPLPCEKTLPALKVNFPCYYDGEQGGYEKLMKGDGGNVNGMIKDGYADTYVQDSKTGYAYRYRPSEDGLNFEISAQLENSNDNDLTTDTTGAGSDSNRYEKGTDKSIRTDGTVSVYPEVPPDWIFEFDITKICTPCLME